MLLFCGTRAYLFSPEKGSGYAFSTRNSCSKLLASDGVNFQGVHQSSYKKRVYGAVRCIKESINVGQFLILKNSVYFFWFEDF